MNPESAAAPASPEGTGEINLPRNRGGRPSKKAIRDGLIAKIRSGELEVEMMIEALRLVRSKGTTASVKLQCLQLLTQFDAKVPDGDNTRSILYELEITEIVNRLVARVRALETHYRKPILEMIPLLAEEGCNPRDPRID